MLRDGMKWTEKEGLSWKEDRQVRVPAREGGRAHGWLSGWVGWVGGLVGCLGWGRVDAHQVDAWVGEVGGWMHGMGRGTTALLLRKASATHVGTACGAAAVLADRPVDRPA